MKRRTKVLLTIAVVLQISSYFLPFIITISGWLFFIEILYTFPINGLEWLDMTLFYAFISPLLSLPILLIGILKQFSNKTVIVLKVALFIFLLCPVLFSVVLVLEGRGEYGLDFLGYGFWVLSFCLMYVAFFFDNRIELQKDDLSNHLIEDEM